MGSVISVRKVNNNKVAVVEKNFGTRHVQHGFIALKGETGFQPDVLRGGIHFYRPLMYSIHKLPLVTITQGKLGYVFARDGAPLASTQGLACNLHEDCRDFEDARSFILAGGQRGPQRMLLREGTYAINLAMFVVICEERVFCHSLSDHDRKLVADMATLIKQRNGFRPLVLNDSDDKLAVVTVHDGPSLPQGTIIAPVVGDDCRDPDTYHNNFQDPDKFLVAGGCRGRQLHVLTEGTYYINTLFCTVEIIKKTTVDVGSVGVVVSYTGGASEDVSGVDFKHGELVRKGEKGVWADPLIPGKYAFNTYAGDIIMVPTTNFILKWTKAEIGTHKLDENLREVTLITKDAFEPNLPLSVVVHIDYRKAPLIVQRFGDVKKLVEQTLDPMVSAYFKNTGQTRTLIELVQERAEIQRQATEEMKGKFAHYNLELEEVLIGTPSQGDQSEAGIELILQQLRDRQVAVEQVKTYERQQLAAGKERDLREAVARANQQERLTTSELSITVNVNEGKAEAQRAVQRAEMTRQTAGAEADKIRAIGAAEAEKTARMGIAEAVALEEKVKAQGGPQFQVVQAVMGGFAEALEKTQADIVPRVVIGKGGDGKGDGKGGVLGALGGDVMEALLTTMLTDKMGMDVSGGGKGGSDSVNPMVEALRKEMLNLSLSSGVSGVRPLPGSVPTKVASDVVEENNDPAQGTKQHSALKKRGTASSSQASISEAGSLINPFNE
eukprot:GFYU01000009.1.p1 GENE.GFYU01000009.1~~GFYU01000009.1.p1  ORF type:complete len:724 (+),score=228.04 GFYU01000009.1:157-2328(+)